MTIGSSCIINYRKKLASVIASLQLTRDQIYHFVTKPVLFGMLCHLLHLCLVLKFQLEFLKDKKDKLTILVCSNISGDH